MTHFKMSRFAPCAVSTTLLLCTSIPNVSHFESSGSEEAVGSASASLPRMGIHTSAAIKLTRKRMNDVSSDKGQAEAWIKEHGGGTPGIPLNNASTALEKAYQYSRTGSSVEKYLGKEMLKNQHLARKAVERSGLALKWVDTAYVNYDKLAKIAVTTSGSNIKHVEEEKLTSTYYDLLKLMVKQDGYNIQYVDKKKCPDTAKYSMLATIAMDQKLRWRDNETSMTFTYLDMVRLKPAQRFQLAMTVADSEDGDLAVVGPEFDVKQCKEIVKTWVKKYAPNIGVAFGELHNISWRVTSLEGYVPNIQKAFEELKNDAKVIKQALDNIPKEEEEKWHKGLMKKLATRLQELTKANAAPEDEEKLEEEEKSEDVQKPEDQQFDGDKQELQKGDEAEKKIINVNDKLQEQEKSGKEEDVVEEQKSSDVENRKEPEDQQSVGDAQERQNVKNFRDEEIIDQSIDSPAEENLVEKQTSDAKISLEEMDRSDSLTQTRSNANAPQTNLMDALKLVMIVCAAAILTLSGFWFLISFWPFLWG